MRVNKALLFNSLKVITTESNKKPRKNYDELCYNKYSTYEQKREQKNVLVYDETKKYEL